MGRALVPGLGAGLGFGITFGYLLTPGPLALAAAGAALLVAAWRRSVVLLWGTAFALGLAIPARDVLPPHLDYQLPALTEITGRVLDIPEPRLKNVSFTLAPDNLPVRLLAYVPHEPRVKPGDRVRLTGRYGVPQPDGWREGLARRGVHGLFWANAAEIVEEGPPGLARWASEVRWALLDRLREVGSSVAVDLLSALLLGARRLLPDEETEAFRTVGVAHVLALSGLHVGILAAGGWWLLGLVRIRPAWRYLLLVPTIGFYVLVGGARVSLIRAGIMFALLGLFWVLWESGWVLRRWLDPLQGLAAAAIVVLLLWPWSALESGFQMSFLATAAIVLFLPGWTGSELRSRLPGWARWPADLLAVTLCAQAGAVPVIGTVFGHVSPFGVLANVLLVPWTALILWGGMTLIVLVALPISGPLWFFVNQILVGPYLVAVRWLASLPGASLPVGPGFGVWCLWAALAVLLVREISAERELPAPHLPVGETRGQRAPRALE